MRTVSSVTGREIRTKRDMMSSETPMRDIASVADDSRNMSCAVPTQAQALENNDGIMSADFYRKQPHLYCCSYTAGNPLIQSNVVNTA